MTILETALVVIGIELAAFALGVTWGRVLTRRREAARTYRPSNVLPFRQAHQRSNGTHRRAGAAPVAGFRRGVGQR